MDSFHNQNNKSYRKQDELYCITILNAFVNFYQNTKKQKNNDFDIGGLWFFVQRQISKSFFDERPQLENFQRSNELDFISTGKMVEFLCYYEELFNYFNRMCVNIRKTICGSVVTAEVFVIG